MTDLYIYSTLSNDQAYTSYGQKVADGVAPKTEHVILIAGKANVSTKHFITPLGAVTKISAEDYAILKQNPMFQIHKENGYITVSEAKDDADKVAASMQGRDKSAPLVEEDFTEEEPALATKRGRKPRGE